MLCTSPGLTLFSPCQPSAPYSTQRKPLSDRLNNNVNLGSSILLFPVGIMYAGHVFSGTIYGELQDVAQHLNRYRNH